MSGNPIKALEKGAVNWTDDSTLNPTNTHTHMSSATERERATALQAVEPTTTTTFVKEPTHKKNASALEAPEREIIKNIYI